MTDTPSTLLRAWLERRLPPAAFAWLGEQLDALAAEGSERKLHITLGMIPRRLGKADLGLTAADLDAAERARPGWDPRWWSVDAAARVLVLRESGGDGAAFAARFSELCRSADVGEKVALYCGLPLYPYPERLLAQVGEGLRTNMRAEFEAIAHRNPYPREQFDDHRWNHMVLKALFIGSLLDPIQGLEERANAELARILRDYAHERWAAGRAVTPELWRCVGPFADVDALADLERALASGNETERRAGALAAAASPTPAARALVERAGAELLPRIESGELSWSSIAQAIRD